MRVGTRTQRTPKLSRSLDEWIGANDDTPTPPRVQLRVIIHYDARCALCTRKIGGPVLWQCDHIKALVNGGENRESNLQPLCLTCHETKTKGDCREKSITYRNTLKHYGIKKRQWRPLLGTKASGWRKRMDGTLERR